MILCTHTSFVSISAESTSSLSCTFSPGDGTGGSEVNIGSQTGSECVRACMRLKETDDSINGVTVFQNQREGCWCEKGMKEVSRSSTYKTCFLLSKNLGRKNHNESHLRACC